VARCSWSKYLDKVLQKYSEGRVRVRVGGAGHAVDDTPGDVVPRPPAGCYNLTRLLLADTICHCAAARRARGAHDFDAGEALLCTWFEGCRDR
jgi:hypothetical protein